MRVEEGPCFGLCAGSPQRGVAGGRFEKRPAAQAARV